MWRRLSQQSKMICLMLIISVVTVVCFDYSIVYKSEMSLGYMIWLVGISMLSVGIVITKIFIWIKKKKNPLSDEQQILTIIFAGFLLRCLFVAICPFYLEQNDVGTLNTKLGHLGYVRYLYENHKLPVIDPREMYQFYHPPLHHAIMAIFLKFNTLLGVSFQRAQENLQALPLFYSGCILTLADKLMVELKSTVRVRKYTLCILGLLPYLVVQAGALNNDALVTVFMLATIVYTLAWYRTRKMKDIILIAICIGCGMMTKMSAALIAPPIAMVFLFILIKERKNIVLYIRQYIVFGAVSLPLGLWFPIRNYIKFGLMPNYIPAAGVTNMQYISKQYGVLERLLLISRRQFENLTVTWDNSIGYPETNIFVALSKYTAFGEYKAHIMFWQVNTILRFLGELVLLLVIILLVVTFVFFFYWFIKVKMDSMQKIFLMLLSVFIMTSYVRFCFLYPYTCTMNVRYILVPLIVMVVCSNIGIQQFIKQKSITILKKLQNMYLGTFFVVTMIMWIFRMIYCTKISM